jgi:hypothetical protein
VYQSKQVGINVILLNTGAVHCNKYCRSNTYVYFQAISIFSWKDEVVTVIKRCHLKAQGGSGGITPYTLTLALDGVKWSTVLLELRYSWAKIIGLSIGLDAGCFPGPISTMS